MRPASFRSALLLVLAITGVTVGCTVGSNEPMRDGGPGPVDADLPVIPGCDPAADMDFDGIADVAEGTGDTDGDGTPNVLDTDSDDDGTSDTDEHLGAGPCSHRDSDSDGIPNSQDPDSDNDGLSDATERGATGTDPYVRDTDGDGFTDLAEIAAATDPNDRTMGIPTDDYFVILPYMSGPVHRNLTFNTNLQLADVYFVIDTTGSMQASLDNVRGSLSRIAADIRTAIPDVHMGVGHHEDFPVGAPTGGPLPIPYGGMGDEAYFNLQDITDSLEEVQTALNGLTLGNGGDGPESQVEALYQIATAEGGEWVASRGGTYSIPERRCPARPDEETSRFGYPCFRPGALPIVVLVTDVIFHNGLDTTLPGGVNYTNLTPAPHTFDEAAAGLDSIGARFIGVGVDGFAEQDMSEMARRTGSVDGAGNPLFYEAPAGGVSDQIIHGITTLATSTPQDVTTDLENVFGNPRDTDATEFIVSVTPVQGYGAGGPGTGFERFDETTFYAVIPGTSVEFDVHFENDFVMPPPTTEIFRCQIVVIGNGVARLDVRNVYILVPPEGGMILL